MNDIVFVVTIIIFAVFTQTIAGFGIALVSMPLLASAIGLEVAAPLVAIIAFTIRPILLLRYRQSFKVWQMWRVIVASFVGVGIGTFLLTLTVNDRLIEALLGLVVIGYALYSLINPHLTPLRSPLWGYCMGFLSGFLARLYNIGGPPVVMYADGQQWDPEAFKGNLQAYGAITSATVMLTRYLNGDFNSVVMQYYLMALPALAVGVLIGFMLERRINANRFRRLVLLMLVVVGLSLVF